MQKSTILMIIFIFIFCLSGVSSLTVDIPKPVNYSEQNVNNSQYLQGYTPTTLRTWIQGFFDSVYCKLTGCTVDGDIQATGYITGKKCGVFASLDSPNNTIVTTAGTYYPIEGIFTNSPIEEFGPATTYTPGIKYTGTKTQYFEIDWHAVGSGDSAGITVYLGIKKNGILCTHGVMGTFLKFIGEKQSLSGTCVIELETNDEIQLVLTANNNGDIITINQFTTTITEFFD